MKGTNVTNNLTEPTENSAQDTNAQKPLKDFKENSTQDTNVAKNQKGTQRIQCAIQ